MTFEEWIVFILFTIGINVFFQTIAWKIGISIAKKREVKKNDNL